MHLESGFILHNRYKILRVLGQGGFGITYLAHDIIENHYVAVKEFFFKDGCERANDGYSVVVSTIAKKELIERFRIKFIKEVNLIKKLNHPNIIHVYDVFTENTTSYYIMEYIEGETLSSIIKVKGHLSESESLNIVNKVANAVEYLHSRKINHLDIKPGNIMISQQDMKITLIDFGVSKQYNLESGEATTTTPVGLSHGYSPLEQYNSGGVNKFTPESDIYSLGATLFKMLSGVTPPNAVDIAHTGITDYPSSISPKMRKAISVIMSPQRRNRPHSIEELKNTLSGQQINDETVLDQNTKTKKNKSPYIIGAIFLCLIAGLGIYFASNRTQSQYEVEEVDIDTATVDTSVIAEIVGTIPKFSVNQLSKSEGKSSLKIDFPKCSNAVLEQNILEWINELLGGTYEGDLKDNNALFNHYASKLGTIDEGYGEYSKTSLTKAYENEFVVTYQDDSEFYGGGIHGIGAVSGKTFRKSDGKLFSNSFINFYKLRDQAVRGLKRYFEVSSDSELLDRLWIGGSSLDELPPPSNDPWIMGDGVHFLYTPYEIASYAEGSPTFTVSIENIKPAVNATAKTFFN